MLLEMEKLSLFQKDLIKYIINWMENIQDWCISRQLWWGHRIPVFYCNDCNNMMVEVDAPCKCSKCGSENYKTR